MATSEYRKISDEASDIDSPTLEAGDTEELLPQAPADTCLRKLPGWAYAIISLGLVILGFVTAQFVDLNLDRKCLVRHSYYCG
jgi:hypothetical protein